MPFDIRKTLSLTQHDLLSAASLSRDRKSERKQRHSARVPSTLGQGARPLPQRIVQTPTLAASSQEVKKAGSQPKSTHAIFSGMTSLAVPSSIVSSQELKEKNITHLSKGFLDSMALRWRWVQAVMPIAIDAIVTKKTISLKGLLGPAFYRGQEAQGGLVQDKLAQDAEIRCELDIVQRLQDELKVYQRVIGDRGLLEAYLSQEEKTKQYSGTHKKPAQEIKRKEAKEVLSISGVQAAQSDYVLARQKYVTEEQPETSEQKYQYEKTMSKHNTMLQELDRVLGKVVPSRLTIKDKELLKIRIQHCLNVSLHADEDSYTQRLEQMYLSNVAVDLLPAHLLLEIVRLQQFNDTSGKMAVIKTLESKMKKNKAKVQAGIIDVKLADQDEISSYLKRQYTQRAIQVTQFGHIERWIKELQQRAAVLKEKVIKIHAKQQSAKEGIQLSLEEEMGLFKSHLTRLLLNDMAKFPWELLPSKQREALKNLLSSQVLPRVKEKSAVLQQAVNTVVKTIRTSMSQAPLSKFQQADGQTLLDVAFIFYAQAHNDTDRRKILEIIDVLFEHGADARTPRHPYTYQGDPKHFQNAYKQAQLPLYNLYDNPSLPVWNWRLIALELKHAPYMVSALLREVHKELLAYVALMIKKFENGHITSKNLHVSGHRRYLAVDQLTDALMYCIKHKDDRMMLTYLNNIKQGKMPGEPKEAWKTGFFGKKGSRLMRAMQRIDKQVKRGVLMAIDPEAEKVIAFRQRRSAARIAREAEMQSLRARVQALQEENMRMKVVLQSVTQTSPVAASKRDSVVLSCNRSESIEKDIIPTIKADGTQKKATHPRMSHEQ